MGRRLAGRVALVTGSGRGIGRAIALALAYEGARLVINDLGADIDGQGRSSAPANEVVAHIREQGGEAVASADSVTDFEGARRMVQAALDAFGRLDILVNNAGFSHECPLYEMPEELCETLVAVHLYGPFNCIRHAAPVMMRQRHGRIVNMVSRGGLLGSAGHAPYGAGKAGQWGLANCLSKELAPYGITINCVSPAATRTRMNERSYARLLAQPNPSPEKLKRYANIAAPEDLVLSQRSF